MGQLCGSSPISVSFLSPTPSTDTVENISRLELFRSFGTLLGTARQLIVFFCTATSFPCDCRSLFRAKFWTVRSDTQTHVRDSKQAAIIYFSNTWRVAPFPAGAGGLLCLNLVAAVAPDETMLRNGVVYLHFATACLLGSVPRVVSRRLVTVKICKHKQTEKKNN